MVSIPFVSLYIFIVTLLNVAIYGAINANTCQIFSSFCNDTHKQMDIYMCI